MVKKVIIGSARIDENNKAHGGKAGDNNGREVSTQSWYDRLTNPWVLIRPKDPVHAEKIARCMEMACANQKIGYDQYQRNTLYNAAKPYGFDAGKVTTAVETDCSALVRVCCAYAGISVENFYTTNQAAVLMTTGLFEKHTASKYIHSPRYLKRGDILVTKRQGHTVVVLNDGDMAYALGARVLQRGDFGPDVGALQTLLIARGRSLPKFGIDHDFGAETETALKNFQKLYGLAITGVTDTETITALYGDAVVPAPPEIPPMNPEPAPDPVPDYMCDWVQATSAVTIRKGPGTSYGKLGELRKGARVLYDGETRGTWRAVQIRNTRYWISATYSKIVTAEKPIIDVSEYNKTINWDKLLPSVSCVILRVGLRSLTKTGKIKQDARFRERAALLKSRGVPVLVYFFGRSSTEAGAIEEANATAAWAQEYGPTGYFYDAEVGSNTPSAIQAFVDRVEALTGKRCGAYIGHHRYAAMHGDKLRLWLRWIPRYGKNKGWDMVAPDFTCDIHQYTSRGKLPGIPGNVDVNRLMGTGVTIEDLRGVR